MIKVAFDPIYAHPLPEGHRFPMEKYELIPQQLQYEGTLDSNHFFSPEIMDEEIIAETHSTKYIEALNQGTINKRDFKAVGFPYSSKLVEREFIITYGSIQCALHALKDGFALNVAGGTHHAFFEHGEGFCIFNDIAVSSNYLLNRRLVKQILVVDLDVHQGNGTASLLQDESRVFTFSMHGLKNYPARKQISNLDIALENQTGDDEYLSILRKKLPQLIDTIKPDFVIFQSGVDVLETDKLGKLALSKQGCYHRDEQVISMLHSKGIPGIAVMGGGYSPRLADVVEAHCNTYRLAAKYYN